MKAKGQFVQTWFDTGAMGAAILFGYVIKAGPKTYTVMWESGIRNRIQQTLLGITIIKDKELLAEAEKTFKERGLLETA